MEQSTRLLDLKNWSWINPKPVIYYEPAIDDWMCFWNGIQLSAYAALVVTNKCVFKSYTQASTHAVLTDQFLRLCSVNVLNKNWTHFDNDYGGIINFYIRNLETHIYENFETTDPYDAFIWFSDYLNWK